MQKPLHNPSGNPVDSVAEKVSVRELTKSAASSSLALSVLGAQQMAELFSGTCNRTPDPGARSMAPVTEVLKAHLSHPLHDIYEMGDELQRGIVDLTGAAIRLDLSAAMKPGTDIVNPLLLGLAAVSRCPEWLVDWQELRNKIDIYDLVRNADRRLNLSNSTSVVQLAERAYAVDDFHALWAVEGAGHYYAARCLEQTSHPQELITSPAFLKLPKAALTMLNAGIGLAFAEALFKPLRPDHPQREFDSTIGHFVHLCRENATEGYAGCAFESLGLVIQAFYPGLLAAVSRSIVAAFDEELLGYYWHGVGRGHYFVLRSFVPCRRINWHKLVDRTNHEIGRRNLVAGLAWAITLVNMRTPQVMERLLHYRGHQIIAVDPKAFANGVASSILVRRDTTPGASFINRFCEFHAAEKPSSNALWSTLVADPCRQALGSLYPIFYRRGLFGQVFRYQSLDDLAQGLR